MLSGKLAALSIWLAYSFYMSKRSLAPHLTICEALLSITVHRDPFLKYNFLPPDA
jgi:hypothetical protein